MFVSLKCMILLMLPHYGQPKVLRAMNEIRIAPFTHEEVKNALFIIGDFKAPGPMVCMPYFINGFGIFWEKI